MNQAIKEQWITALTSGEYKQGHEQLREDNKFCCLGVLCDLYHKETGKGRWTEDGFTLNGSSAMVGHLPEIVLAWADLDDEDQQMLILHNDAYMPWGSAKTFPSHSFRQIAELIEHYL